jgi:hypothetical protein
MSSPDKIKAIILTCDRYRAITQHLIVQVQTIVARSSVRLPYSLSGAGRSEQRTDQIFLTAFELPDADGTYQFVANRRAKSVKPVGEDIRSHMRKVTPGDYREKLRPETIAELNRRFSEVLDALGYSSPRYEAKHLPSIVK